MVNHATPEGSMPVPDPTKLTTAGHEAALHLAFSYFRDGGFRDTSHCGMAKGIDRTGPTFHD